MIRLIPPALISEIDRVAENEWGIPQSELMERAGNAVCDALSARIAPGEKVLILAGPGNNGGDGFAAGVSLLAKGYFPYVLPVLPDRPASGVAREWEERYISAGGGILPPDADLSGFRAIVDAMFGAGARPGLPDGVADLIERVNRTDALRVAIDLPTGIDGECGRVGKHVFSAAVTVTFPSPKRGMVSYPARGFCGEIVLSDIGLDLDRIAARFPLPDRLSDADLCRSLLPARPADGHKGTFGRALLLCGSPRYRGAALLASESALSCGAGLVELVSDPSVLPLAVLRCPSVIGRAFPGFPDGSRDLLSALSGASAFLCGCGLGASDELCFFLWDLFATPGCPVVLDADALNALALHREASLEKMKDARRPLVLTPHPAEFARLSGKTVGEVQEDRLSVARDFASNQRVTLVLKGAATLIVSPEGAVTVNPTGGSGLSKGGSGDVLAGALVSLLAQGMNPTDAATLAVWLHGRAGDTLTREYSPYGVRPDDLPRQIARELAFLTSENRV